MGINLQKGQTINLDKDQYDLSSVTVGLGWSVRKKESGFFGKLLGGQEEEYDLDAIAFMLNSNGKVANLGDELKGSDIIFFNNQKLIDGTVHSTGDNREGGSGSSDDEQIIVKLNSLNPRYEKIVFYVSIYEGRKKNQHFGMIQNAYIRAVDAKGNEIARYNLSSDSSFNNMCSMVFGEVYKKGDSWKFRAIGEPKSTDSFIDVLKSDYIQIQ